MSILNRKGYEMRVLVNKPDMKIKFEDEPVISMLPEVYGEMMYYVNMFEGEVSGCGLVEVIEHQIPRKDKPNKIQLEFKVVRLFLPEEQINTSAHTDIKPEGIHKLINQLVGEGVDTGKLVFHWHSHADMGVFHSGEDDDNYDTLGYGDYLVSIVANKKGELFGAVDFRKPFEFRLSGLPVGIDVISEKLQLNILEDNVKKVKAYEESQKKPIDQVINGFRQGINSHSGYVQDSYDVDDYWNDGVIGGAGRDEVVSSVGDEDDATSWSDLLNTLSPAEKQEFMRHRGVLRRSMGISKKEAKRFENCESTQCGVCADRSICTRYLESLYGIV